MMLEFRKLLSKIYDPRRGQGKKWQLDKILLVTILAVLSGAVSYRKIHSFIDIHLDLLNEALGLEWKTAPAYSSVRTIIRNLDAGDVEKVFREHASILGDMQPSEDVEDMTVVAFDGKVLRHSFDDFEDRKAAQIMSAFAIDADLVLGHMKVSDKSNEIPAMQKMIAEMGLEGCLFTADAMHCQKNF